MAAASVSLGYKLQGKYLANLVAFLKAYIVVFGRRGPITEMLSLVLIWTPIFFVKSIYDSAWVR